MSKLLAFASEKRPKHAAAFDLHDEKRDLEARMQQFDDGNSETTALTPARCSVPNFEPRRVDYDYNSVLRRVIALKAKSERAEKARFVSGYVERCAHRYRA